VLCNLSIILCIVFFGRRGVKLCRRNCKGFSPDGKYCYDIIILRISPYSSAYIYYNNTFISRSLKVKVYNCSDSPNESGKFESTKIRRFRSCIVLVVPLQPAAPYWKIVSLQWHALFVKDFAEHYNYFTCRYWNEKQ